MAGVNDQEFKRMMSRKAKKIEQRLDRIDEEVGRKLRAMEPWKLE
jgi:hypothetical protein